MSKTFAEGDILTAQDVNEHLVNNITRTVRGGSDVATLTSGNSIITDAWAIEDRDQDGHRTVSVAMEVLILIPIAEGHNNFDIATLATPLRPHIQTSTSGVIGGTAVGLDITASGRIRFRYSVNSLPSTTLYLSFSYPVRNQ